jgi:hypothetical protein
MLDLDAYRPDVELRMRRHRPQGGHDPTRSSWIMAGFFMDMIFGDHPG